MARRVLKNLKKIRFGLCCLFREEPIAFRQVTAKTLQPLPRAEQLGRVSEICLHNTRGVLAALCYVAGNGIGAFRIMTPLFPRYTHPEVGYQLAELPDAEAIHRLGEEIRALGKKHDIRLSFHPDQFNVLSSPRPEVVAKTIRELEYQNMLAELFGAEVINIHAGGIYGNKGEALARLQETIQALAPAIRNRLTLENDDVSYSPADLLPVCENLAIPMVYDVHHHRCLADNLSEPEVTERVVALWQRRGQEPYFHLSSPKNGWQSGSPRPHADYVDPADFPTCWQDLSATVDIEAKAKELAIFQLQRDLGLRKK